MNENISLLNKIKDVTVANPDRLQHNGKWSPDRIDQTVNDLIQKCNLSKVSNAYPQLHYLVQEWHDNINQAKFSQSLNKSINEGFIRLSERSTREHELVTLRDQESKDNKDNSVNQGNIQRQHCKALLKMKLAENNYIGIDGSDRSRYRRAVAYAYTVNNNNNNNN